MDHRDFDASLFQPHDNTGKLTEEEFEIMKTHTTAGEELLIHAKEELGESEYLNTAVEAFFAAISSADKIERFC